MQTAQLQSRTQAIIEAYAATVAEERARDFQFESQFRNDPINRRLIDIVDNNQIARVTAGGFDGFAQVITSIHSMAAYKNRAANAWLACRRMQHYHRFYYNTEEPMNGLAREAAALTREAVTKFQANLFGRVQ